MTCTRRSTCLDAMIDSIRILLLLLPNFVVCERFLSSARCSLPLPAAFAAGGFGASSSTKNQKKNKKNGKKKSKFMDIDVSHKSKRKEVDPGEKSKPQLDRFGLPIPTEDDIFPPLPADTELISVEKDEIINKEEMREALKDHIQLNFDLFDDDGVEMDSRDDREPMKLRLLHKSPPVLTIDNFFCPRECEEYIKLADPAQDATVEASGGAMIVDSKTFALSMATRTSTTWFCKYSQVPTLLAKTSRLLNDLPIDRIEEPQIVRYRNGEEFSYHYDEIPPPQLANGGQRLATMLVYLRSLDEGKGGSTEFRDLKNAAGNSLAVRPTKGSALLFFPAFANGVPDERTLHRGEVAQEEKLIAQVWVHEKSYKAAVPPGNFQKDAMEAVLLAKNHDMP